jgi:hypothetical protein
MELTVHRGTEELVLALEFPKPAPVDAQQGA